MAEQTLADVAARIYALPFGEFVPARTAAAKMATGAKQPSLAADVRSLPKPSVAAWTVNMLAARQPETLRDVVELGRSMRDAQAALDAAELRRLGQERRKLLGDAVRAATAVAEQQGRKISAAIAAEVEETLRAATADVGAAAAVQSGRLLRGLSADGVDGVDLSGAVAVPGPAAAPPGAVREAAQPRLRAVRQEPRRVPPSAVERARAALAEAGSAARAAAEEARQQQKELAESTLLAAELAEAVRDLREQLAQGEQNLITARKRRELAGVRAHQAKRAADKTSRAEELARERVLRLGNTPG